MGTFLLWFQGDTFNVVQQKGTWPSFQHCLPESPPFDHNFHVSADSLDDHPIEARIPFVSPHILRPKLR